MAGDGNGNGNGNGNGSGHEISIHDMPEVNVKEESVETGGYRAAGQHGTGQGKTIYTRTGNRRLAGQILTPPGSLNEAAAWTALNFKNVEEVRKIHAIMDAINHCLEFNIQSGLDEIQLYLTMIPAAGGWGRALAAMIETGIIVPSGLGVTKNVEEEVKKAIKKKEEEDVQQKSN